MHFLMLTVESSRLEEVHGSIKLSSSTLRNIQCIKATSHEGEFPKTFIFFLFLPLQKLQMSLVEFLPEDKQNYEYLELGVTLLLAKVHIHLDV
ncbi:hypothetical protein CDAR_95591 [Caerostris darwini]|uniref:Uncharacterized protein n=1 Tax=Caerostris darwini TaxID=1538125 RepID=A0AAV4M8L1_9ARAC|nr:hypothetical protein CDAR_95591 [Caerostris darwini]